MHDTLAYLAREPIYRCYHHNELTFGLLYAFTENFVLPLSHDEVVHGKGSLIAKMPGDGWQQFANLRAYYAFMWGYPGKKLLFMGQEFAQGAEWSEARGLDWWQLDIPAHQGVQSLVRDLNALYRSRPALHARDCEGEGFSWLVADDHANSVYAWLRKAPDAQPVVGHLELHAGAAPRLRRADAESRPLARDPQHRRRKPTAEAAVGNLGAVTAEHEGSWRARDPDRCRRWRRSGSSWSAEQ